MSQPEIIIRRLHKEHLAGILEIEQLSFASPWSKEAYLRELTENQLAYYYGCFMDERLLAFAGFWLIVDEGHIANVAVHPDARGQGMGELLVRSIITACQAMGGKSMTLEVRESNMAARNLYRKLGFHKAGRRVQYYTDNQEDALIMWLEITPPPISSLETAEEDDVS